MCTRTVGSGIPVPKNRDIARHVDDPRRRSTCVFERRREHVGWCPVVKTTCHLDRDAKRPRQHELRDLIVDLAGKHALAGRGRSGFRNRRVIPRQSVADLLEPYHVPT
jgi:hypothetical protein